MFAKNQYRLLAGWFLMLAGTILLVPVEMWLLSLYLRANWAIGVEGAPSNALMPIIGFLYANEYTILVWVLVTFVAWFVTSHGCDENKPGLALVSGTIAAVFGAWWVIKMVETGSDLYAPILNLDQGWYLIIAVLPAFIGGMLLRHDQWTKRHGRLQTS